MRIQICIGSSCHLKGSREVIALFQENIAKYNLDAKVELAGSFCMGECQADGVSVCIDDNKRIKVTVSNFNEMFEKYVLKVVGR